MTPTGVALLLGLAGSAAVAEEPAVIPVGLDAYRMWERWPVQRIGARAYMRSTYDRRGGNEGADASHFLYQQADDFNVTLDVAGPGMLYFARYNHWHGSPWHYEVDGRDHIVKESNSADPTKRVENSVFLPEKQFPNPLTWTWSTTKGADLMWVPIGFADRFRMAYSRTHYGTGYYIYHHYDAAAKLSQPIRPWDGAAVPDADVLDLLRASGTDIHQRDLQRTPGRAVKEAGGSFDLQPNETKAVARLDRAPAMLRALRFSAPKDQAVALGRARLRITWDDRSQPSIDAPVALFFGAGTLYNRDDKEYLVKAMPVNVRFADGRVHLACYFPMPFFRSAKIELVNGDTELKDVQWAVRTEPYTGPARQVAYFHATYRDHVHPVRGHDLVWLDTKGVEGGEQWSGHFVGTSFIFTRRGELGTLEGDPRFFFDDSETPQAYGTGTEEWGGGGDYWGGRTMTLPLAGHPVGARHRKEAKNDEDLIHSAYRFLLADLMPFGKRAVIRFEHGGENDSTEHYQTVAYWYGVPAPTLVRTDLLNVGDAASEQAHGYQSPNASPPYAVASRYEWGVDHAPTETISDGPLAKPESYAEFEFEADAGKRYFIWLRGKSDGDHRTDASWFQFDDEIGTTKLPQNGRHPKGMGNWRDVTQAGVYSWCSALPNYPPQSVTFHRAGKHRLRVQPRHSPHVIDQIWLTTQPERPSRLMQSVAKPRRHGAPIAEIVLDANDVKKLAGAFAVMPDGGASVGKALKVDGRTSRNAPSKVEVYPARTMVGRTTKTHSEFTLTLDPNNLGVLLRRTLDYSFPNQRAKVLVAAVDDDGESGAFRPAGVWYLAGSNTCVYSNPRGELGATQHIVQTSNRRFRDDEFLISRSLTAGKKAIRVRVEFTPVEIPLFPGRPLPELAWSEIRYAAYCYRLPDFDPTKDQ
jgi:hypothetical protein